MTETTQTPYSPEDGPGLPPFLLGQAAANAPRQTQPEISYVRRTKMDSLDDLDQESPEEPYHFELRGQQFSMISPQDADWMSISAAREDPRLLVHILMPEDDRMRFLQLQDVRLRVLAGLMDRWQKHFGLPTAGESEGSARS
jgi:hypothetical protein